MGGGWPDSGVGCELAVTTVAERGSEGLDRCCLRQNADDQLLVCKLRMNKSPFRLLTYL